jgi:hypothetical protein
MREKEQGAGEQGARRKEKGEGTIQRSGLVELFPSPFSLLPVLRYDLKRRFRYVVKPSKPRVS